MIPTRILGHEPDRTHLIGHSVSNQVFQARKNAADHLDQTACINQGESLMDSATGCCRIWSHTHSPSFLKFASCPDEALEQSSPGPSFHLSSFFCSLCKSAGPSGLGLRNLSLRISSSQRSHSSKALVFVKMANNDHLLFHSLLYTHSSLLSIGYFFRAFFALLDTAKGISS